MEYVDEIKEKLIIAYSYIPDDRRPNVEQFLELNELQLAWEEMEAIANQLDITSGSFWKAMAQAAGLMVEGLESQEGEIE